MIDNRQAEFLAVRDAAGNITGYERNPLFGYVGGYVNENGEMVGGHPAESVMEADRNAAGINPGQPY